MKLSEEAALKESLTALLDAWLDTASRDVELPYMGHKAPELMAAAALSVLLALDDMEQWLRDDGAIRENW